MAAQDVVVIGGGPGGYVAAIRAAQLGLSVVVVEAEALGGVCLNWGCIPTKSLLVSAETYHKAQNLADFGVSAQDVRFDLGVMVDRSRAVSKQLSSGVSYLLKKNNVSTILGRATGVRALKDMFEISVEGHDTVCARNVVIATGGRALVPAGMEVDGTHVWTSKEAMVQRTCPKSLIVVGSGAIGLEFASFYQHLGTQVDLIEAEERLLPTADPYICETLQELLQKRGIKCHLGRRMQSLSIKSGKCHVALEGGDVLKSDHVLLALGVRANVEELGLENLGIPLERGRISVNGHFETTRRGIYAIGDVVDGPWLAHKASHEGVLCAEHIAGHQVHAISKQNIPACIYSTPQVASVGLTEPEARAQGREINVGIFPFQANGKALAMGSSFGGVKTIFDAQTGECLGAHMIGAGVTELISNVVLAKTLEATEAELAHTVFPHPTLSEALHESVLSALGRAIHF